MEKTNTLKRIPVYITIVLLGFGLVLTGCDAGFDSMNIDETAINELEPMMILNDQIRLTPNSGIYGHLLYDVACVQQMVTPFGQTLAGCNFNQDNQTTWVVNYWDDDYTILHHTIDIIQRTQDDPDYHNARQMARIWRAFAGLLITDTVGDAPFSEAGLAYHGDILNPGYDSQQNIYETALGEILQATEALDTSSRIETTDILYAGDIAKWKKFGYSLLLRHAMRLSEIAPGTAQQYAEAAYNGGVFQSNADNAMLLRNENFQFSLANTFNGGESANFYLTDGFVNYLRENNDPRLRSFAVRYIGATSGSQQNERLNRTIDPDDQIGMPLGHDQTSIETAAAADGLESFYSYTQIDRDRIASQTAPDFLITYAQTQLLLAEAAERGWVPGNGADYFEAGVRAHLEQMELHHADMAIPANEIDTYVNAQKQAYLGGNIYEHIHTQYWVAGFLITPREVFSNWRRTGYPELAPNPYPNQEISGEFIRRRPYVEREFTVNTDAVQAAIQNQGWGGNNLDARVWWDTGSYNP